MIHDAIIVGDGAPMAHYGGTGVGDTKIDEIGIETSQNLGKRVTELAMRLNDFYVKSITSDRAINYGQY